MEKGGMKALGNKIGVEVGLEKDGLYMLGNERMKLHGRGMKIGKLADKSVSNRGFASRQMNRIDGPNGTRSHRISRSLAGVIESTHGASQIPLGFNMLGFQPSLFHK